MEQLKKALRSKFKSLLTELMKEKKKNNIFPLKQAHSF